MKLYVVHRNRSGYAREDIPVGDVVGAYTDKEIARKISLLSNGGYVEVEVDDVPPGIRAAAPEFGFTL